MTVANAQEKLIVLEDRRMAAMERSDAVALRETLAEDFEQVHGDGSVDDREKAIAAAMAMPRRAIVPRDLAIRLFGDHALLTGPTTLAIRMEGEERHVRVFIGQLARRDAEGWRFIWAQVTMMPPDA